MSKYWTAKCDGMDATVVRSDGRVIVVGDLIYHPDNAEIARVIADALNYELLTDAERKEEKEAILRNLRHDNGMWLMHVSQRDRTIIENMLERLSK